MNIKKAKLLGSSYIGLFGIANDKLCFVPHSTDEKTMKTIEETLDVKAVKISIYESSLLAVFSKINNKEIFLPSYALPKEIETIEKEIKVKVINTEQALGNLIEINDTGAVVSLSLKEETAKQLTKNGLEIVQTNLAKTDAVGSSIVLTNKSFLISPKATMEEVKNIQDKLNIKGGSSTANTGDSFVRNSVLANTKGIIAGDLTTGFELNRIEEALEG